MAASTRTLATEEANSGSDSNAAETLAPASAHLDRATQSSTVQTRFSHDFVVKEPPKAFTHIQVPPTISPVDCQTALDSHRSASFHITIVYDMLWAAHVSPGHRCPVYFNVTNVLFLKRLVWLRVSLHVIWYLCIVAVVTKTK